MGLQEASEPPPRHSTHHHHRCHDQPAHQKGSYDISISDNRSRLKHRRRPNKRKSALVEPDRTSQPPTRHGIVESWLDQTASQNPPPPSSRSQDRPKDAAGDSHASRPLDTTSPYNKHLGRADPRWRPRHVFPSGNLRQLDPPLQSLELGDSRRSTRRRTAPSDSSIISGFENSTKARDYNPEPIRHDHGMNSPTRPPRETALAPMYASSTTSHLDEPTSFEKRPRRKTREDKYETKKKKRSRGQDFATDHDDDHRKKRKNTGKRKPGMSSKHVVNNFTSGAVFNDRITVQPHLKPGLFDNGRTSKKKPISDLAYSKMQFLKHQKRNTQPKALSASRAREKQRENREMEEVYSFFLPQRPDRTSRKSGHDSRIDHTDHHPLERRSRQLVPTRSQEPPKSTPLSHPLSSGHKPVFHTTRDRASSLNSHEAVDDRKDAMSRNTEYWTWSSSRQSPQPSRREDRPSSVVSESEWTTTPEPIRRDLIATGIYRNTGIQRYDDNFPDQNMEKTIEVRTSNVCHSASVDDYRDPDKGFNTSRKVEYRDQAVMTECLPRHSVPLSQVQRTEDHQVNKPRSNSISEASGNAQLDRQQIARETHLGPIKTATSRQDNQTPSTQGAVEVVTGNHSPRLAQVMVDQNRVAQGQEASDQASMASRDAMPPPPIPHNRKESIEVGGANIIEVEPPGEILSSVDLAPEVLEASHTVEPNNDSQGSAEGCNPTTSESVGTIERTIPSFNPASWIPQRTPSARIVDTQSVPRRPTNQSPIYVDQLRGELNEFSYQRGLTSTPQIPRRIESMSEFIRRIESESQIQSLRRGYDVLDSESGVDGVDEASLNFAPSEAGGLHRRLSTSSAEVDTHAEWAHDAHTLYRNADGSGIEEQLGRGFYAEEQIPQDDAEVMSKTVRSYEDVGEEHFEMSNFWQPTRFSQY
ncbi:hypothetical protein GGR54DRAFT_270036 [Hypoxylon sp. NC1633]|nr:hypothetical protein GGR54DRAFT_270036 [Hypoxylon sp. NC1633]